MPWVLDASALLAYLCDERGAELVARAIADGAAISTVNLSEVLSRAADRGADPVALEEQRSRVSDPLPASWGYHWEIERASRLQAGLTCLRSRRIGRGHSSI